MKFLRLHVWQKALLLLFFSLFLLPVAIFGRTYKSFFSYISSFVTQDGVARIKLLSLETQANVFFKATLIVKFRMCEYDIPCALEKIVMGDLITWSSKITWQTKTIISPLPQCLKPQNSVGW